MKEFNIENWYRKEQYHFFKTYQDPFFNLTANLEVTNLYDYCKNKKLSFSLACLFIALKSVNEIEPFKLRIKNNKVYVFDEVHIGSTILNDNKTFSFCYFKNEKSIFYFDKAGKKVIANHKKGFKFEPKEGKLNLIHCSTLPWVSFTSFKHARNGNEGSLGIPKIVFGKMSVKEQKREIPFSVEVHHALMDGYHVGLLFEKMQYFIDNLN